MHSAALRPLHHPSGCSRGVSARGSGPSLGKLPVPGVSLRSLI